jgi:ketosteroid isomerase-like protein
MDLERSQQVSSPATIEFLEGFSQAWNDHDIDALMSFITDDCVFHTAAGPDVKGNTISGREAVRESFQMVWKNFPDVAWLDADHFIAGDRGVSESTFCATQADGSRIEARMVDVFTFKNGKIQVKNAFRKDRPVVKLND